MSKRKWHARAIHLAVALALTLGLLMVPAASAQVTETEVCGCLGADNGADTAEWSTTEEHPDPETLTVMGAYSALLDKDAGTVGPTYVQFIPPAGTTFGDLQDAITAAAPKWSFWHFLESTGVTNGPQFELRFEDPNSVGWLEVTAVGLQGTTGTDAWVEETLAGATLAGYGGIGEAGVSFFKWAPLTALSGIEAAVNAETPVTSASDWVLERVRVELWEAHDHSCYIDDITLDGERYDLEPCYYLDPSIAKNVKTAEATFTVVDVCGNAIGNTTAVSNWIVIKGEGAGEVVTVGGGADLNDFITVNMGTTGDCLITCDVDYDGTGGKDVTLHAEKKWGEIYYTELTAWSDTPCEQRPTGAADTEISRVIDLGGAASFDVLVQEAVIAEFLPGPVPAYAGGAKITWWLLKNDAAGLCQDELEELVELFDSYDYVSGELGYGHGCGQYAEWAITNPDPDFIPEDLIDAIYALYPAVDTLFTDAECDAALVDTTKTVTHTDHAGDPLGEGFTNVLVEFSEVGTTDLAEPAIVVVLADYPIDKNGQNAVCVEYFKFKSTIVVIPEVCQVKVPQVRWAGEKIVLEKDWETDPSQLVGFFLEEGCIGNMIPLSDQNSWGSEDARTVFTKTDSYGVARAMFETEQQGQVDVKCVLYGVVNDLGEMTFDDIVAQTSSDELEVVGNHGFLVYYLALEEVAVDPALSDLTAIDAGDDADVLVKVKGWFTSDALPGTSRLPVDANGDLVYELPAGRYVLPDDWSALAGSDEATSNMASRPQYDLMNTPGDGVDSSAELGPYDSGVRTTTPPGEADNPVIGPFNTLQPWNCVDDEGDPTNMWIADDVVPADYTVAVAITGPRNAADMRNTVVPDTTIDEFDCPMPQALVTFDVDDTEVLAALDKGNVFFSGTGVDKVYTAPFYSMEIPSHWLIPVGGYRWDSWGLWTTTTADDGPYDFWADLGITPTADDILEVYTDNHGYAGVTIDGEDLADECVTLDVIADFPVMAAKYPAVDTTREVCWGIAVEHLNADFEVSDRTGEASITISFYGLRTAGTGAPWTTGGTTPYVKAEWDFDGDGGIDATIEGATSAVTLATQTFEFTAAGSYSPWLRVTDDNGLVDICEKPNYIILTNEGNTALPGDANGDGEVNIFDITYLERILVGLEDETPGADANQDGDVNIFDITYLEMIIVGIV